MPMNIIVAPEVPRAVVLKTFGRLAGLWAASRAVTKLPASCSMPTAMSSSGGRSLSPKGTIGSHCRSGLANYGAQGVRVGPQDTFADGLPPVLVHRPHSVSSHIAT